MPTVRRLRSLLAVTVVVLGVAPFAARAGAPTGDDLLACDIVGQVAPLPNHWARISAPPVAAGEGDTRIESFAAPPYQPKRIYATNGQVIQASTTAGCKWDHIYPATSSVPAPKVTSRRVAKLVAPTDESLWVASYDADGVPRPHVEMTINAAPGTDGPMKAFQTVDNGLPPVGTPIALGVARKEESGAPMPRAFVLIEDVANPLGVDGEQGAPRTLYHLIHDPTVDKGGLDIRWEKATGVPADFGRIEGMVTTVRNVYGVWIWSGTKYAFSPDNGDHFTVWNAPGQVTAIDVSDRDRAFVAVDLGGGKAKAIELGLGEDIKYRVETTRPLPIIATSVSHGQEGGVWTIAGTRGTYGWDVGFGGWVPIHPPGVSGFVATAMGMSMTEDRILLGQAAGALYRFDLYRHEAFLPPPPSKGGTGIYPDVPPFGIDQPMLWVQHHDVTVRPTEVKPDKVDLGVPPNPSPLEVFFLLDTTTSMQSSIDGLKLGIQNIADEIAAKTHGKACFGVGEFKDEQPFQKSGTEAAVSEAYSRRLPITCEGQDLPLLHAAVDKMKEGGGNNVQYEAATVALRQAVIGDGQPSPPVLPNLDAEFSGGDTMRVIVLITDAGFMTGAQFPSMGDTIKALNSRRVNVVGIVVRDTNTFTDAWDDVTEVVEGTHTTAPENGVDCNGDHKSDIDPGKPLVCEADGAAPPIGPAIIGLLLGVKDNGTVAVSVGDPYHVVKKIDGNMSEVRNLRVENHLPLKLHLTCSMEQDGMDLPVRLLGFQSAVPRASEKITVHCRAPKIPPPPPPPPRPPEPELPLPPRPPIAPVLIPQFQPPPVNNPPGNLNPNAGFSQQEEQQLQLAAVGQGASEEAPEEEEVELAMSAVQEQDAAAAGLVLGCAMFVGLAGAVGLAHRRRTQRSTRTAYARVR